MLSEYVEKIMRNGITNFAKKANKTPNEIQILIGWDEANQRPKYKKLVHGASSEQITFNEILNVKFDMLNREAIVGQFITGLFDKYSKSLDCMMNQLFVIISLDSDGVSLELNLYKGKDFVEKLELEQLLM